MRKNTNSLFIDAYAYHNMTCTNAPMLSTGRTRVLLQISATLSRIDMQLTLRVSPLCKILAASFSLSCPVGAHVVSMIHTARLSSTNTLVDVQPVESLAIAAVSGFTSK